MRRLLALSLIVGPLAACAGTSPPVGQETRRVEGDEQSARVYGLPAIDDARIVAAKHCEQWGRSPQYVHTLPNMSGYEFLCVRS